MRTTPTFWVPGLRKERRIRTGAGAIVFHRSFFPEREEGLPIPNDVNP